MNILDGIDIVVLDFDQTIFSLQSKWENLTDVNRKEIEWAGVGKRTLEQPILDTLYRLSESYKLAIFSRNLKSTIGRALDNSGWDRPIFIVGRQEAKVKPDPQGLQVISEHYGSQKMVMVGDSWHDVAAARNARIPSVIVENKSQLFRPGQATYYIKDLSELICDEP